MFHYLVLLLALLAPGAPAADAGLHRSAAPAAVPTPTFAEQVVELTNIERLNNGSLPPLKQVAALDAAAQGHSAAMAQRDFFMHCDPDTGKLPWDRMQDAGYSYICAAENLAAGYSYTTPAAVVEGWMSSPGHKNNILSPEVWELGIGYYYQSDDQATVRLSATGTCTTTSTTNGPYWHYWAQNFGLRSAYYPVVIEREAFYADSINVALYVYGPAGATAMRFSNDAATWSDWEPFANARAWTLGAGNGSKTVYSQVAAGGNTYVYSDTIVLYAPPPVAVAAGLMSPTAPITLTWEHAAPNLHYTLHRSATQPYFTPGDENSTPVGGTILPPSSGPVRAEDPTAAPGVSYFYVARAVGGDGVSVADSDPVGRFVFTLVAGG